MKSTIGKPRGILNLKAGEKKFQLSRYLPAQDLSFFIEHFKTIVGRTPAEYAKSLSGI